MKFVDRVYIISMHKNGIRRQNLYNDLLSAGFGNDKIEWVHAIDGSQLDIDELLDENKVPRPFSFIAIGGQDNGSSLNGHNYTYVGSEWGKFVDILIKNKCMNPIIFIDELDKVSKTENGKEIIGILTHLVDSTQNDCFQDKYFNGIELDLSKALFIFSYNDAELIDKILLDRVHRIKFEHLNYPMNFRLYIPLFLGRANNIHHLNTY